MAEKPVFAADFADALQFPPIHNWNCTIEGPSRLTSYLNTAGSAVLASTRVLRWQVALPPLNASGAALSNAPALSTANRR